MVRTAEVKKQESTAREMALTSAALRIAATLSQSPLGFNAGDANLYRYVSNNPTNATDPNGLEQFGPDYCRQLSPGAFRVDLGAGLGSVRLNTHRGNEQSPPLREALRSADSMVSRAIAALRRWDEIDSGTPLLRNTPSFLTLSDPVLRNMYMNRLLEIQAALRADRRITFEFAWNGPPFGASRDTFAWVFFDRNDMPGNRIYLTPLFFEDRSQGNRPVVLIHEMGRMLFALHETGTGTHRDPYKLRDIVRFLNNWADELRIQ